MNKSVLNGGCSALLLMMVAGLVLTLVPAGEAQLLGTERRYIRVGPLQTFYSSFGREWGDDDGNGIFEGLMWPADYPYQDNAVINIFFLGCSDFTNAQGDPFEKFAFPVTADLSAINLSIFPVEFKQVSKFEMPAVIVDGNNVSARYAEDVDEIDPTLIADRKIVNTIHTVMGLTIKREIYYFTQQYHNNYFIKVFTFTNTGNTDYDDEIERTTPLKGVRYSTGVRYSVSREGAMKIGGTQFWGQQTYVTRRGENYAAHAGETLTEANPIVDWLRCGMAWAGQKRENAFDNIGGPDVAGTGRLCAPHHAGSVILHVDRSGTEKTDDVNQPVVLGWHAADEQTFFSTGLLTKNDLPNMIKLYDMLAGQPLRGLGGNERFDEKYAASNPDAFTVHMDAGGTDLWVCYGPWDLEHGESITIVEAEGIHGLSRQMCETIGRRWKQAYGNAADKGPFTLPDGSTTTDKDIYKNSWVFTGKDSLLLTFSRAKRNFDAGLMIPQPPQPPPFVEVTSGGDRITISWAASPSEAEPGFGGYKVFRAIGRTDTVFQEIFSGGAGVYAYDDVQATRGKAYYYYVVAFSDGSGNSAGILNPRGPLYSSKFYGLAGEPAYLRRQAGTHLADIRVVPNPFNILSSKLQYVGEADKIMFLNIPGHCTIRIFTERGDLIHVIYHENGSGDESWNSVTSSRQVVVSGVYIVQFEVTEDHRDPQTNQVLYKKGDTAYRKLVIIR